MKKTITTLLTALIIIAVIDVAVVAAAASTTYATAPQPTKITITNYPKQVKVGQDFDVTGRLTAGNTGLGNKLIYHDWRDNNGTWWWSWNFTTNADGSFTDTFSFDAPGTYYDAYYFAGDNQYAWCVSDTMVITVVS
jgi:hypothetical protein